MFRLSAFLRQWFGRPANPSQGHSGTAVTPGDPYSEPHFPLRYHATDHPLSYGIPDRADVITWIDREIAKHAHANTLDEGTRTILDAELDKQHGQWVESIRLYARAQRSRTALALRNDQAASLVATRERLTLARLEVDRHAARERHLGEILAGGAVTVTPIDVAAPRAHASSSGILPADVPGLTPLDSLLPSTWTTPGDARSARGEVDGDSTVRAITTADRRRGGRS